MGSGPAGGGARDVDAVPLPVEGSAGKSAGNISWVISSESMRLREMAAGGAPGRSIDKLVGRGAPSGVGGATRRAGGPLDRVRA